MHYPNEKWFPIEDDALLPNGILDDYLLDYFDPNAELTPELLVDLQSGNYDRGIVAMPYVRQSDEQNRLHSTKYYCQPLCLKWHVCRQYEI